MRLSDCFIELIAYLTYLLKSPELEKRSYDEVKETVASLLADSERHPARGAVAQQDYDLARFAVCAWIDEAILGSSWPPKRRWLNDQLQRLYYHTTDAGEEFFRRLDTVGPQQNEVREVYYLCLALGFVGRYCRTGDDHHLEQIRSANLKILLDSPLTLPALERAKLFPESDPTPAAPPADEGGKRHSRLATGLCLGAPVLLFSLLYLVYRLALDGISENVLKTVAG